MFQHLRLRYVYGNMEIKQRWLQQIINTNADYFLLFYLFIIHYYHVITELWCKVCIKGGVIITYQYKTMLPHCCWDKYHCKEKTFKVELGSYLITIEYYNLMWFHLCPFTNLSTSCCSMDASGLKSDFTIKNPPSESAFCWPDLKYVPLSNQIMYEMKIHNLTREKTEDIRSVCSEKHEHLTCCIRYSGSLLCPSALSSRENKRSSSFYSESSRSGAGNWNHASALTTSSKHINHLREDSQNRHR